MTERRCAAPISKVESHTAISRKAVRKNVHATIAKGNMGYAQYTVPDTVDTLALADICPWPLLLFFQISLKNSKLKTTHTTFRGCRVPCIRLVFIPYQIAYLKGGGGLNRAFTVSILAR